MCYFPGVRWEVLDLEGFTIPPFIINQLCNSASPKFTFGHISKIIDMTKTKIKHISTVFQSYQKKFITAHSIVNTTFYEKVTCIFLSHMKKLI